MRWLAGILLLLLLGLQYRLWVGDGSLAEVHALKGEIVAQKVELKRLRIRNQALQAEVQDLREGLDALEERARSELGMIKQGEVFLQVIEERGDGQDGEPLAASQNKLPVTRDGGSKSMRGDRVEELVRRDAAVDAGGDP
jgi:cell division protein FtsB